MAFGKNKGWNKNTEKYRAALEGRKIPVLTLDNKWHKLFTQTGSTPRIESLSRKLNELLQKQGRANTEMKDIRKLKKKLMDNIVTSMDAAEEVSIVDKKMEESSRLIEECNEKLKNCQKESESLPKEIEDANYRLMLETMAICYDRLKQNKQEIDEISDWIVKTRIELKKKLLKKQEDEIANHDLYSYMHDIFGADVLEIFDMEYIPEDKKQQDKQEQQEK